MRVEIATVVCCLATGCANLEKDCRGDWYRTGLRDGLGGWQIDLGTYARQCARYGIAPDEARYIQGWRDGFGELHLREKLRPGA